MSWEYAPSFDAAHRAALNSGKNLIFVCHPAWWATLPLFRQFPTSSDPGTRTLVLVPEASGIAESAALLQSIDSCRPAHAATGLTRTTRLLRAGAVNTLVTTPADMMRILSRSGLDSQAIDRVVIGWPETHSNPATLETLDRILADCKNAQRITITADPTSMADFLERHSRRAPTAIGVAAPEEPSGSVRYATCDFLSAPRAARAALDILDPASALIWDPLPQGVRTDALLVDAVGVNVVSDPGDEPVELAIALELPSADAYLALQTVAQDVLVLVRAHQIPYISSLANSARSLRLPDESDRVLGRAAKLRQQLREQIEHNELGDGLLTLAPLFDEHDPATVAAALASRLSRESEPAVDESDVPTWVRIRLDAGRKDRIRTGDLVGALLNAVEVPKKQVGRVDVRDSFSLVEVRAEVADKALRGLNGMALRGNNLAARIDRH